jgi:NAD(P)H-quinone oxidoreductase subunit 4L
VLFGTAGIYFQLNYSFLGAVQLLIYAGGITVLYVFSILLTSSQGDKAEDLKGYKLFVGLGAALASLGICLWITPRLPALAFRARRTARADHRPRADEQRKIRLHPAVRGDQPAAAGLHRRRHPHRAQTLKNTTMIHMEYYLIVSTVMMFVGIYGFVTRRNLLAMLISVELILNSVDINFVVFNRFLFPEQLEGFFFALFAIGISAAETAVAIAIIINIYRNIRNIGARSLREMKW